MHMIIRALVYAKNKDDALGNARNIFENMVGENSIFDYFTMFNEDGSGGSGKDRWGELSPVSNIDTKEGKKLLEDGWKFTRNDQKECLKKIRSQVNKPMDKLLEDSDFKYLCYSLGQYRGPNVWLYDPDGEGIREERHLKNVLAKWETLYKSKKKNPHRNEKIWIIPADVHF